MQKNVQHIIKNLCNYKNYFWLILCIRLITKRINPLDHVNIPPDHPPETITKVSTIERNRIHNLTRQINNIIMGKTSTGSNNTDYNATPPRVPMVAPDDDDLLTPSVP